MTLRVDHLRLQRLRIRPFFFIGDPEAETVTTDASVYKEALTQLLQHPNDIVREATRRALASACRTPVLPGMDEEAVTDMMAEAEVQQAPAEVNGDEEDVIDIAGLQPPSAVNMEIESSMAKVDVHQAPSCKVLHADVVHATMFEDATANGDVTSEVAAAIGQYPNVTHAYRIGRLVIQGGTTGTVVAKIKVINDGHISWASSCTLCLAAGPGYGLEALGLGSLAPGEMAEVVMDLSISAADVDAVARSVWVMCDEHGQPFGSLFVLEVAHV